MKCDRPGFESTERVARVFICSTFEDLKVERELIANRVMPELRARARGIDVEVVVVDLRWGIPPSEARKGGTVQTCLQELSQCGYLVSLIGDRYGWIPYGSDFSDHLVSAFPALQGGFGRISMTHLEVRQWFAGGELRNERTFCFRRDSSALDPADEPRISELVGEICTAGVVVIKFGSSERMVEQLLEGLWLKIRADFPTDHPRTPLEMRSASHDSYARVLRRDVVGRGVQISDIVSSIRDKQLTLIGGPAGIGKSAVIAAALHAHKTARPNDLVICRFRDRTDLGHSPSYVAHDVVEALSGKVRGTGYGASSALETRQRLDGVFRYAESGFLGSGRNLVIGLDWNLDPQTSVAFEWLPRPLPEWVRVVATVRDSALTADGHGLEGGMIDLQPMGTDESIEILIKNLSHSGKRLSQRQLIRICQHPAAANPAFLRAVIHNISGVESFRALPWRLYRCLGERDLSGVLRRTLALSERRFGRRAIHQTIVAVLASGEEGMSESEIVEFSGVSMATWVGIREYLSDWLHIHDGVVHIRSESLISGAIGARNFPTPDAFIDLCRQLCEWRLATPPTARGARTLHVQSGCIRDSNLQFRVLTSPSFGPWIISSVPIAQLASSWTAAFSSFARGDSRAFTVEVLDGSYAAWSARGDLDWPAIPIGASDFRQRINWLREAILGNDCGDSR